MTTHKILIAALMSGALIAGTAAPALAGGPMKDGMPIDQVLQKLSEAGYTDVRSIEADDGVWKGKASRDGRSVKVSVDPQSGAVVEKGARAHDDD
ncbi:MULTISPECIES: PepSY domain-containing protein [unclassified Methylobacterium]|uniref:PepSY domain-containing protein n=1 Tax=unclassified Methylobacterium TaxID=2615210 RepID=UPI0036FACD7E